VFVSLSLIIAGVLLKPEQREFGYSCRSFGKAISSQNDAQAIEKKKHCSSTICNMKGLKRKNH
jgi:hypothetical protein